MYGTHHDGFNGCHASSRGSVAPLSIKSGAGGLGGNSGGGNGFLPGGPECGLIGDCKPTVATLLGGGGGYMSRVDGKSWNEEVEPFVPFSIPKACPSKLRCLVTDVDNSTGFRGIGGLFDFVDETD